MLKLFFPITLFMNLMLSPFNYAFAQGNAGFSTYSPQEPEKTINNNPREIGIINWEAEESIFPSIYMTDGNKKVYADWGGVYPLKNLMKSSPDAYEHALKYESNAKLVKWLSVGTLGFFAAALFGGAGESDSLFAIGAVGTMISSGAALRYQSKAMYHLYKAVNIYNREIKLNAPQMSLNWKSSF